MKKYNTILFDLDGTIIKSDPGVLNSITHAMEKLSLPMPDVPGRLFIGPPLSFSFDTYCHVPAERIDDALKFYREYYSSTGIFECSVYDGVKELLQKLRDARKTLLVASSKPEAYVKRILESFDILKYFSFVGGADFEGLRSEKEEVLTYTLESAGITDTSDCLMVGDRKYDIVGAKFFGMDSAGVLYGYGTAEELKESGATYIFDAPDGLLELLAE